MRLNLRSARSTRGLGLWRATAVSFLFGISVLTLSLWFVPNAQAQTSSEREYLKTVKLLAGIVVPEIRSSTALDKSFLKLGRSICRTLDSGASVRVVTNLIYAGLTSVDAGDRAVIASALVVAAKSDLCPRHENKKY